MVYYVEPVMWVHDKFLKLYNYQIRHSPTKDSHSSNAGSSPIFQNLTRLTRPSSLRMEHDDGDQWVASTATVGIMRGVV